MPEEKQRDKDWPSRTASHFPASTVIQTKVVLEPIDFTFYSLNVIFFLNSNAVYNLWDCSHPCQRQRTFTVDQKLENSSPGGDGVPMNIIKEVGTILSPILFHICNSFLTTGMFPEQLKIASHSNLLS